TALDNMLERLADTLRPLAIEKNAAGNLRAPRLVYVVTIVLLALSGFVYASFWGGYDDSRDIGVWSLLSLLAVSLPILALIGLLSGEE
ncbi:hypothetical protein, partial [Isoptericola croceus]|uniref:hypothetical protein n=1 Tax=Isoptericola croceus TaxID=3031406 RepID=UPI0023F80E23